MLFVSFFEYLEKIELYCSKENYNLGIFRELENFVLFILVLAFLSQEIALQEAFNNNTNLLETFGY